jgi:hypothetical protein
VWTLPPAEAFMMAGKEWLLHLLSDAPVDTRPKVISSFGESGTVGITSSTAMERLLLQCWLSS